ncbi:MAG: hypothetical protein ACRDTJ_08865 [Pseudonocardiaceae bacterium]
MSQLFANSATVGGYVMRRPASASPDRPPGGRHRRAALYKYFSDIEAIMVAWHER